MIKIVVALSLMITSIMGGLDGPSEPLLPADVDLSAVRYIMCHNDRGYYTGSAFLIGDHELATARHVAHGDQCTDVETGTEVKSFYEDDVHDFALMSAPGLPTNLPYLKYRCDGIKAGQPYLSYGITAYMQEVPIIRENTLRATKTLVDTDNDVSDFPHSKGMRVFDGYVAPGMSGGPVTDIDGYVVAVNNAGSETQTLLYDLKDSVLCKK